MDEASQLGADVELDAPATLDPSALLRTAREEGFGEGRATAYAELEAQMAQQRLTFETRLAAERERWANAESEALASAIKDSFATIESRIAASVERVLAPFVVEAVRRRDPKDTEMGSGPNVKESPNESKSRQCNPSTKMKGDVTYRTGPDAPARTEAALFRDPYAVLAEIAARAPAATPASCSGTTADAAADPSKPFSDPFTTAPNEQEMAPESLLPLARSSGARDKEIQGKEFPEKESQLNESKGKQVNEPHARAATNALMPQEAAAGAASSKGLDQQDNKPSDEASHAEKSPEAERAVAKLKSDIGDAIINSPHVPDLPHIEVQATAEGILISLTDDGRYSMFAIGSAEPQHETVQIMEKIGRILKGGSESIVIRGHTDGRPYRSTSYDNWRLSSARAHMALYMLVRGGVSEKRVENVEGYADHRLKSPSNPNAAENRRIEILLRKEKS